MEEGEWGRETGRRLGGAPLGDKRGKRLDQLHPKILQLVDQPFRLTNIRT